MQERNKNFTCWEDYHNLVFKKIFSMSSHSYSITFEIYMQFLRVFKAGVAADVVEKENKAN